ncbi:MAG: GIY-YIG nuclease family protein, partial [Methylophilaceae bacterium]|nr:GIY-YIG nuclease family protein [Methylophilaceae bacterium]
MDKNQYGYIYVMSNPSFRNNLLKIGQSSKNPFEFRKNELFTTGVPLPFSVEYYASIQDFARVERNIHKRLQEWRVNKNREF